MIIMVTLFYPQFMRMTFHVLFTTNTDGPTVW